MKNGHIGSKGLWRALICLHYLLFFSIKCNKWYHWADTTDTDLCFPITHRINSNSFTSSVQPYITTFVMLLLPPHPLLQTMLLCATQVSQAHSQLRGFFFVVPLPEVLFPRVLTWVAPSLHRCHNSVTSSERLLLITLRFPTFSTCPSLKFSCFLKWFTCFFL